MKIKILVAAAAVALALGGWAGVAIGGDNGKHDAPPPPPWITKDGRVDCSFKGKVPLLKGDGTKDHKKDANGKDVFVDAVSCAGPEVTP